MNSLRPCISKCHSATRLLGTPAPAITEAVQLHPRPLQHRAGITTSTLGTPKQEAKFSPTARRTAFMQSPPRSPSCTSNTQATYTTAATTSGGPTIHHIFEPITGTWQYVVADPSTKAAAIIDPVLDYDPITHEVTTAAADALLSLIDEKGYHIAWILETHAHADHLTSAFYLQTRLAKSQPDRKPPVGIGKRIDKVQALFGHRYRIPTAEYTGVFNKLFDDDETFHIGALPATALHLPGHTPDHLGYRIGANIFCGDSLFHPDIGTARCDFPGGSAAALYASCQRLLALPPDTKIWTGHDYPPEGRAAPAPYASVAEHRARNALVREGATRDAFERERARRDARLKAPRLLHQALQVNVRAGRMPEPEGGEGGGRWLRVPVKVGEWE